MGSYPMANIAGKAYGFTAFTATRPLKTLGLRLSFLLVRVASRPMVQRLFRGIRIVSTQKDLNNLSFIHFARWVIIPRRKLNKFPDQPRENLAYDYMLFESNFNGDWEQYIQAFSSVIPGGMNLLWRWSPKFPGAEPLTPFLVYIRHCQLDTDHYYSAYPGAATSDIKAALHLAKAYDEFAKRAADVPEAGFEAAHNRFLDRIKMDLGTIGPAPWADDPKEAVNILGAG